MLNSCILTGNLGADPEVFYSSEGDPVATFNLAFRSLLMTANMEPFDDRPNGATLGSG